MKALWDGIFLEYTNDVPLLGAMPKLYIREQVPEEAAMPYGAMWRVSEAPDRTFASTYDGLTIQFDIYTEGNNIEAIWDIEIKHKAAFDRAALTIVAHNHIVMLFEFAEGPMREADCWHTALQYYCEVQR